MWGLLSIKEFFKPVYSSVKFNQMIGRGTRLCPDLFGLGEDKEKFFIFDLCNNFEFFQQGLKESDPKLTDSLTTILVKTRLKLSQVIEESLITSDSPEFDADNENLRNSLLDILHHHVATMEKDNFFVRRNLKQVEEFSERSRWDNLNDTDTDQINESLAHLPNNLPKEDEQDHIAIHKLKRNIPLTESDLSELEKMFFSSEEIESRERFEQVYGKEKSLKLFIREIVGLDRSAVKQVFGKYFDESNFTANQIRFVEHIIDYLTQNGTMNPEQLYESPFTDLHTNGLDGVFDDNAADEIVSLVNSYRLSF